MKNSKHFEERHNAEQKRVIENLENFFNNCGVIQYIPYGLTTESNDNGNSEII